MRPTVAADASPPRRLHSVQTRTPTDAHSDEHALCTNVHSTSKSGLRIQEAALQAVLRSECAHPDERGLGAGAVGRQFLEMSNDGRPADSSDDGMPGMSALGTGSSRAGGLDADGSGDEAGRVASNGGAETGSYTPFRSRRITSRFGHDL